MTKVSGSSALNPAKEEKMNLNTISFKEMNATFKLLRQPYELDTKSKVVDYNWVVDGILKNSTPYESHKANAAQALKVLKKPSAKKSEGLSQMQEKLEPKKIMLANKKKPGPETILGKRKKFETSNRKLTSSETLNNKRPKGGAIEI